LILPKNHIAILLMGIFTFPIIFQPVHILWHHYHGYQGIRHSFSDESSENNIVIYSETHSHQEVFCPVCEFKFSINSIPKVFVFKSIVPVILLLYKVFITKEYYRQVFTNKSPRAPPLQSC